MILHDKKEGGLVRGQIVVYNSWTASKLKFDGSKLSVLEPCDQTHTLSSLENILHYLIQYNCQRITSENWKLFSIRGHTPTVLFPIHKISFSSRLSHVLLDRVYNKVHKIVLYFTFCVQYCTRYLIEKPYSAGEQYLIYCS